MEFNFRKEAVFFQEKNHTDLRVSRNQIPISFGAIQMSVDGTTSHARVRLVSIRRAASAIGIFWWRIYIRMT